LIGTLADLNKVRTEEGTTDVKGFQDRAMWSWLRLHHTKRIDQEIKDLAGKMNQRGPNLKLIYKPALEELILEHLVDDKAQRQIQYIIADGEIKAVATTKHLLIPPQEVEAVANEILQATRITVEEDPHLKGLVATTETVGGLRYGFHVFPGDILTRRAISVSAYVGVIMCLNPLTWAGIGNFGRFGLSPKHERILRIQKRSELRPRMEAAIKGAGQEISALRKMVDYARTNRVDPREAKIILSAFSKSYGIGDKVIQELLGRLESEDRTTYGMSQAASWVARHGESWKKPKEGQEEHARQSMAVVGAASLLVEDPRLTREKAEKWLKGQWPEWPEWLTP